MKCGTYDCEREAVVSVIVKTPRMFAAGNYPCCAECYTGFEPAHVVRVLELVRP